MIVRVTNRGNQHYGHYGIVYKDSEHFERLMILFLKDDENKQCIKTGFATKLEVEQVPDEENRDAFGWPEPLCDSVVHNVATDLRLLVEDGKKYRAIKKLLKDER